MIRALAFDVYGTLVDLVSISRVFEEIGIADRIDMRSFIYEWQSKQLQYAWMVTLLIKGDDNNIRYNRLESFSDLSISALKYIMKMHRLGDLKEDQIKAIKEAQLHLQPYPGVKEGLQVLRSHITGKSGSFYEANVKMAILSNGVKSHTDTLLSNAGLRNYFDEILSAEDTQRYKPSPEAYLEVSKVLKIPISEIALVSSNLWDIIGANNVGMASCWINRERQSVNDEIEAKPDYTFATLAEIKQVLSS